VAKRITETNHSPNLQMMQPQSSKAKPLLLALFWLVVAPGYTVAQATKGPWNTVRLGVQEWMTENLEADHFRNGDPIPRARSSREWARAAEQGQPAWCYYDNDPGKGREFGRLYNWYAVSDPRGLAPEGWRIPSRGEWEELADHLGGHRGCGPEMKSESGWACGKNGTNKSGFNGLPAGIRSHDGNFEYLGQYAYWWASDEFNELYAYYKYLYWNSKVLFPYINYYKGSGFSVRCLKNPSP